MVAFFGLTMELERQQLWGNGGNKDYAALHVGERAGDSESLGLRRSTKSTRRRSSSRRRRLRLQVQAESTA